MGTINHCTGRSSDGRCLGTFRKFRTHGRLSKTRLIKIVPHGRGCKKLGKRISKTRNVVFEHRQVKKAKRSSIKKK